MWCWLDYVSKKRGDIQLMFKLYFFFILEYLKTYLANRLAEKTSNPVMVNQNKINSRKFNYSYYVTAIIVDIVVRIKKKKNC